jgi:DNA-binding transcriptional LysR family regulator
MLVSDSIDALVERRIDLAVVRGPLPPLPAGIASSKFDEARLMLGVPNGDPLSGGKSAKWRDLDGQVVLMMRDPVGVGLREVTEQLFLRHGVVPRQIRFVGDMTTLVGLIASGVGVALLPEDIARSHRGVTAVVIGSSTENVAAMIITTRPIITTLVRHLVERLEHAR